MNNLDLVPIKNLLGKRFIIPDYQRGYRWKDYHVTRLLNDIWDFSTNDPSNRDPYYCLQPIAVKRLEDDKGFEVIDGQQRLTTIFLILKNLEKLIDSDLKNFDAITYQSKPSVGKFLLNPVLENKNKNIDNYHIYDAFTAINDWFLDKANGGYPSVRSTVLTPFLERTQIIWYEIEDDSNAIDIFTRINDGKIPLTNAELIKALFLSRKKYNLENDEAERQIQLQIASEWDRIEYSLRDNAFWYFISAGKKTYSTRIEYIFDLMEGKTPEHEDHWTFYRFNNRYNDDTNIEDIWLSVKKYFQTFEEWFMDKTLYHLIGYLIEIDFPVETLKTESGKRTKAEFVKYLKGTIKEKLKLNLDDMKYNSKNVKNALLLFNIQTIISNTDSNLRFDFYRYQSNHWDIEHIRSQKTGIPNGEKQSKWLKDVLAYFTGEEDRDLQKRAIPTLDEDYKELAREIDETLNITKMTYHYFAPLYDKVLKYFEEYDEPDNIDSISNLTLLDSKTNRSYKNAVFPVKRKIIMKNDMEGTFIPICTKNLFLKYHSKKLQNVMFWQKSDAEDYFASLKNMLRDYLPKEELKEEGAR